MNKRFNILCFQPYNQTVVYIESVLEKMAKDGHRTYFLSFAKKGDSHKNMERFGCKSYTLSKPLKVPILYHALRIWQLISFCKSHKIDIVYSHYQEANIVAVFAQLFLKSKFVLTRHHSDCGYIDHNWREIYADKVINNLAEVCIAPSQKVYDQMVNTEGCNVNKVRKINYGYNFNNFEPANLIKVKSIREKYNSQLLIVMAARFIPEKRHVLFFKVIDELVSEQYNVKAVVPGRGPEEENLKAYVTKHNLDNYIHFPGFQKDIQNYFAAADLIVHLSVSEASNSAIKEAALLEKTAIVCKGVGDFDDYFVHGENGYLINSTDSEKELLQIIRQLYNNKEVLKHQGKRLKEAVIKRFSINKIYPEYTLLHQEIFNR